jgi:hypothetical protein
LRHTSIDVYLYAVLPVKMVAEVTPRRYFLPGHGFGKFIAPFRIARCCIYWQNCWSPWKRCFGKTSRRNGRKKGAKDDFATQHRLISDGRRRRGRPRSATEEPFERTQGTEAAP